MVLLMVLMGSWLFGEDLAPPHARLPEGAALWLQLLKTK